MGSPLEHGRDTAMYQDLQQIRQLYSAWVRDRKTDQLPDDEMKRIAFQIEELLEELAEDLNQPL